MNYLSVQDCCFVDRPGGMERVAWDLCEIMRDRGHRVSVLTYDYAAPDQRRPHTTHDGIDVWRCPKPVLPGWHPARLQRSVAAVAAFARQNLADQQWDLIHGHSQMSTAGALDGLGPRPRCVFTMHSPIVLENRINWARQGLVGRLKLLMGQGQLMRLERRVLERAAAIQTLSAFTRDRIRELHGLDHKVTIIPHWRREDFVRRHSHDEARAKLQWPTDAPVLFTIRRLGPRYGLDIAIRAVAPLAREGKCYFYIGGGGSWKARLEAIIQEEGVGDRIKLLGRLSDEDLILAYEAADMFLLPTLALECFGLIVLEALSFGCPVISSDAAAIPETMRPILPQCIVPAGDVAALRAKVAEFVEGRLNLPTAAELEAHVEQHYNRQDITTRHVALLEDTEPA